MDKDRNRDEARDAYQDFLSDINEQFARQSQEKDFMDSIPGEPVEDEDEEVDVGQRVRAVRQKRGLTLEDVSRRTDLDVGLLASIEDGAVVPPLGTVIKLARALEMKMGYFISGQENRPFTIVRSHDRKVVSRYDSNKGKRYGYEYISLAPHKVDRHMEPFIVVLAPAETEEDRSTHDGQEFIYVLEGAMAVYLEDQRYVLETGDAIYYDSTVPHLVKCHGDKPARILAVLYTER